MTKELGASGEAVGENFLLNLHILKTSVGFDKVNIVREEAVDDFGGELRLAVQSGELVLFTEAGVGFVLTEGIACHLQGVAYLSTERKEEAVFRTSDEALGGVQRTIVEAGVVSVDSLDAPGRTHIAEDGADGAEAAKLSFATLDIVPVLGNFIGEVGEAHELLIEEDIRNHIGAGFIDLTACIDNRKANIIAKRVIKGIGGFGVDYKEFFGHFWFLSFVILCIYYIGVRTMGITFIKR